MPSLKFHKITSLVDPTITSDGAENTSREDLEVGDVLMVEAVDIQGTAVFDIMDKPPGSTSEFVVISPTREALFIDVPGRWRCRVADTFDGSRVQHTFASPSVKRGLIPPAHNERASPDANLADQDPGTWVDDSESNAGGKVTGYTDDIHKLFAAVEADADAVKLDVPSEFDSLPVVTPVAGDKVLIERGVDGSKAVADAAVLAGDQTASEVEFAPSGDIAATDVQAAIEEVRDDTDTKLTGKAAATHATAHQDGGGDEIDVAGLSGLLADAQTPADHALGGAAHTGVIGDIDGYTKSEVNVLVDATLKAPEAFAPSGTYPVTYDGAAVERGDSFRITSAGTLGAVTVNTEDLLIALVDTPAQVDANWMVAESNRDQATETVKGVAELATQAEADAGTNDTNIITPLKMATAPVNAHTVASHSDTAATGPQLDTLVGGGATALHKHDHGAQDGLGDDDHAQYLLADGTRDLTDDLAVTALKKIDGRDLSVDGAKLDGIEPDAKDDQSAAEVLFAPDGDIEATDAQAAIVEVRDDADTKLAGKSDSAHTHAHSDTTGKTADDHHAEDHSSRHESGGADEISVGGLSGVLADAQTPAAHTHTHASTTGQGTDDHHSQAHTVASHSDTVATGPDLDALVGGGNANGLHIHDPAQLFRWSFSTNTSASDPGSGNVRANSATPASITAMYFSSDDAEGLDFNNFFSNIPVGELISAQQTDDSTKIVVFTVASALTDNTGWWTVPVTVVSDTGGLFQNNKDTSWLIRMRM